ncbi:MAG: AAA family ATPase [Deltaproteobacteria bacterium]|nr:AAA family ATPase [Deltaproteobacteria bacterium]
MIKCPRCQHQNHENAKFCQECGNKLAASSITGKTLSIRKPERKRVTALFSDLSGYTAMTEKHDPEIVKEITSHIFDGTRAIIRKFDGFIERFAGDGFLALFGVPRSHEDDPIRAIQAAWEIHHFVESLNARYKTKVARVLSMHSGINTGLAVTADVNPEKGTHGVTGEAINVASRLSDLADAGDILVGEETYKASKGQFTFEILKPVKVKGKSETILLYKVLSKKTANDFGIRKMQVSSEMIGRDHELAKLELHVLKAVDGQGSVVNVLGEPGVGKSRLIAELRQRDVVNRVTFLEGRSISIGKNLSFHPIINLFKQWAKIKEEDAQAAASSKLEAAIHRACGDKKNEVFPFIAIMMGMRLAGKHFQRVEGIEGEALEKLILKNVRDLLIQATEFNPIVIVMEDLQWADTTSLELLESLFRVAQNHRVLFINVFRPGYWQGDDRKLEAFPEWLPGVDFTEIYIRPLDKQMGEVLINNILKIKGFQSKIKQKILDRSGGNPFFIEEIVRSFIDEGAIVRKDGAFEVTQKINNVMIPTTINDVLMARIDRLETQTRDLIKVASVIGRSFFDRILKEVADSINGVDDRLAYLKDAQFIRNHIRMEELEHMFKHALAQEAAYESTLIQQRKVLHRKVAQAIEKVFQRRIHEFYGMLAYHYSKGEDLGNAEKYMTKAGEEAMKVSASSEALSYLQEALKLYRDRHGEHADPGKIAMIEKNIALAFYNRGQYVDAIEYFDRALNYYWGKLPRHYISETYQFLLGFFHFLISLYLPFLKFKQTPTQSDNESVDLFFKKLKALAIVNPKRFFVESFHFYKRVTKFELSKFELGIGLFVGASTFFSFTGISFGLSRKVIEFAKNKVDRNDMKSFTVYDFSETLHHYLKGNWNQIKECDEDLMNKNLSIGDLYWASQHCFWHALPKLFQGKFEFTERITQKLNQFHETYENDLSMLLKYLLNTSMLLECRRLREAMAEVEKATEFGQRKCLDSSQIEMYSRKAYINVLMGEVDNAKISLDLADKVRKEIGTTPWQLVDFYRGQCEYNLFQLRECLSKGRKKETSLYQKKTNKSLKVFLKLTKKVAQYRVDSYRLTGVYCWLMSRQRKALRWWQRAIREGEHLEARIELSRTYFEMGERMFGPDSKYKRFGGFKAEEYLEKAKELFEEMNLQWDLDQLNRSDRG